MSTKMPKVLKIFDIRKQTFKDKQTGEMVTKGKVVFNKGIEVFYNGQQIDLGQYAGGFLKKAEEVADSLDTAVEKFGLDAEYAEGQKAFLEEKQVTSVFEVNTQKK